MYDFKDFIFRHVYVHVHIYSINDFVNILSLNIKNAQSTKKMINSCISAMDWIKLH